MITNSGWFGITENYERAQESIDQALLAIRKLREIEGFKAGKEKDDMPAGFVVARDRLGIIDTPNAPAGVVHAAEELDALAALVIQDVHIRELELCRSSTAKTSFRRSLGTMLDSSLSKRRVTCRFTVVLPYAEGPDDSVIWQARG